MKQLLLRGYILALSLLSCAELSSGSNILIISTAASHSHSIWCNKLAQLLLNRGHKVTILDTDPPRKMLANLTTYYLEGGYDFANEMDYLQSSLENSPKEAIDYLYDTSLSSCRNMLLSPTFKVFLAEHSNKTKPFDLIIQDISNCECFLGLVPALGHPKLVLISAFGEAQALYAMRSQGNLVHTPLQYTPFSHPMSYIEKLKNLFYNLYNYYRYHKYVNLLDGYSKDIFGQSTAHILEISRSAAVALVNAHPFIYGAKYYSPAIVHVPGFHIDEPKELDAETQAFLDGAHHGAIYFSLGSNLQSSLMSADKIEVFLNVFKKLKQRVLWKFEDESITSLPENVKISKWFPQNEVLAHSNIKIFITHSGLMSTQEAIYYGIPMITMPFFLDQHFVAQRLAKEGVAIPLLYSKLTENTVQQAIQEALTNSSYTIKLKIWSRIFKDRPVKPKDLAIYWIENVLSFDDHKYLQPPEAFLNTLELIFFDSKTILGIITGILMVLIISCCCNLNSKKLKKD